jgi:hypothetical protein
MAADVTFVGIPPKEGHIRKSDVNHIKEGFGGGWNKKQLIDAVKILEVAKVHQDRPPEKAGQDMLKIACDAVQKCCAKASTLAKASEKAYLIHWTDEVIQRPSVPGHRTKR